MNLRMPTEIRDWMFANAGAAPQRGGKGLFAAMLILAGIGAAAAPLVADLLSAVAGVLIVSLLLAAWTTARQSRGPVGTTHLLKAV